jgi:tetratricopeptide (TPR) repeat protein
MTNILAVCILLALLGCNRVNKEEKFKELMDQAKQLVKQEKYDEARIRLFKAADLLPKDPQVYYELAEIFVALQRFDKAVEYYNETINKDPAHKNARLHLAALYLAGRSFEQAENHIVKLTELYPNDDEIIVAQAGLESSARKNYTKSKELLRNVLARNPDQVSALVGMASISMAEENMKEAEEFLLRAAKIDPKNVSIQTVLADIFARQGRVDEAQEMIEKIVKENPTKSDFRYGLAEFLLRRGLTDKASVEYEEILKRDPKNVEARERLYDIYLAYRRTDDAKKLAEDLKKADPDGPGSEYFMGRNAELNGKTEEALVLYQKARPGLPTFSPIHRRLGFIMIAKGDVTAGLQHLNEAIAANPVDVEARLALAQNALYNRKFSEASEHVDQILRVYPKQLGANIIRADVALIEGNSDRARGVYQFLIDTFPNAPTGYFKMALLEEREKNYEKAIELLKKTLSFDMGVLAPVQQLVDVVTKQYGLARTISELKALLEDSQNSKPEYKLALGSVTMNDTLDPDRLAKARKYFTESVEERPDLLGAYFALAVIDQQEGNTEAAIANYRTLVAKNPKHVPSHMLLGITLERTGKFKEAVEAYKHLLKLQPRFGPACNNLAWILAENLNSELDYALELAQTAKQIMPNEAAVTDTLGWVHYKKGSYKAAEAFLKEAVTQAKTINKEIVDPQILMHLATTQKALNQLDDAKNTVREALRYTPESSPYRKTVEEFAATVGVR